MTTTFCYREMTKKENIKGLSFFSWTIWAFSSFIFWFLFLLYAIPISFLLLAVLYIMEFFDEDIYDIIKANMHIKSKYYYA